MEIMKSACDVYKYAKWIGNRFSVTSLTLGLELFNELKEPRAHFRVGCERSLKDRDKLPPDAVEIIEEIADADV